MISFNLVNQILIIFRLLFNLKGWSTTSCWDYQPWWVVTLSSCLMTTGSGRWPRRCGAPTLSRRRVPRKRPFRMRTWGSRCFWESSSSCHQIYLRLWGNLNIMLSMYTKSVKKKYLPAKFLRVVSYSVSMVIRIID